MFKIGVGIGEGTDDYSVGVMAVSSAVSELRRDGVDHTPSAALLFVSSKYNYEAIVRGVQSVLGENVAIVGTSTAGEITKQGPTLRESVVITLLASDTITFAGCAAKNLSTDADSCGKAAAAMMQQQLGNEMDLLLLFSDGLAPDVSSVIKSAAAQLTAPPAIVGASSADGVSFQETAQLYGEDVLTDAAVGLGFAGKLHYSVGMGHGWNPVGAPRTVTEANGATIVAIDDEPAFTFYRDYLGEKEADKLKQATLSEVALSYPMGTCDPESGEWLLRAPIKILDDGAIQCGAAIPTGTTIQLMMGSREDAVKAAKTAAKGALEHMTGPIVGALVFSNCIRNTLFAETHASKHEIEAIRGIIGESVPIAGFYTYAEQAPLLPTGSTDLSAVSQYMNASIVVLLLGEQEL